MAAPFKHAQCDCSTAWTLLFIAREGLSHLIVLFICARDSWTVRQLYKWKKMGPVSLTHLICLNIENPDSFPCLSVIFNLNRNKFLISSKILHFFDSLYRRLPQAVFSVLLLIPIQNSIKTNTN